jgi:hypothetical protein
MWGEQAVTHPTLDGDREWIALQSAQQAAGPARTVASTSGTATCTPQGASTNLSTLTWATAVTSSTGRRSELTWLASQP